MVPSKEQRPLPFRRHETYRRQCLSGHDPADSRKQAGGKGPPHPRARAPDLYGEGMSKKWPKVRQREVIRNRKELATIDALLPSILDKAFKGEL